MIVIPSAAARKWLRVLLPYGVIPALVLLGAALAQREQYALVILLVTAAAFVLFQAVQVVVPVLPGGLGCLAGVVLFGPWQGFLYNYVGICAGSLAAFDIARSCGRPLLYRMFPASLIEKYDRWSEEKGRFARWFALLIFLPVAPDDYLCFLAGTTGISWQKYTAIILLCKPFSIALYSLGLTVAARQLLGLCA